MMNTTTTTRTSWMTAFIVSCLMCLLFPMTAAAGDFTDNGDGTVTDNSTGLMWSKKGHAYPNYMTYLEAYSKAPEYTGGKKIGWRIPSEAEMKDLYSNMKSGVSPFTIRSPYLPVWTRIPCDVYGGGRGKTIFSIDSGLSRCISADNNAFLWPVRDTN